MDCNAGPAAVTVNCAVPKMLPLLVEVAVIVTGPPAFTPVATPEVLIVAMVLSEEVQFTLTVPVVPSEKWPVAVNGCVSPATTLADVGATVIVCRVAGTVEPVEPQTVPSQAVIVTLPGARAKALPEFVASFVMETSAAFEELHMTESRVCWPPPLKIPVAVNRWNVPKGIDGAAGVTEIEVSPG